MWNEMGFQKLSRLYLRRQNGTITETLILFKIHAVFKQKTYKYSTLRSDEVCSKSIKSEAIFTKTEMNNKWNVNFPQKCPLHI